MKEAWTRDLERILWEQAVHNRGRTRPEVRINWEYSDADEFMCLLEIRMQERVFMGIGNKPFMDIKPSDAAISDRAVNCVLIGRGTPGFTDVFFITLVV